MLVATTVLLLWSLAILASPLSSDQGPRAQYNRPDSADVIQGDFIVHFYSNHSLQQHEKFLRRNISTEAHFMEFRRLPGYRAVLDDETVHNTIRHDPGVRLVEHNIKRYASTSTNTSVSSSSRKRSNNVLVPWLEKRGAFGVADIASFGKLSWNQKMLAWGAAGWRQLKNKAVKAARYTLRNAGEGTVLYLLDTPVGDIEEFTGVTDRVYRIVRPFSNLEPALPEGAVVSPEHGTVMASVAIGKSIGTAPWGTIASGNIYDENLETSDYTLMRMIDYIIGVHQQHLSNNDYRGAVITTGVKENLKTGGLEQFINAAVNSGILFVTGAGVEGQETSEENPGSYPCAFKSVICVGSVDILRNKDRTDFGTSVAIYAPGIDVTGALPNGDINQIDGDNPALAAAQVAAILTIYQSWGNYRQNTQGLLTALMRNAKESDKRFGGKIVPIAQTGMILNPGGRPLGVVPATNEPFIGGGSERFSYGSNTQNIQEAVVDEADRKQSASNAQDDDKAGSVNASLAAVYTSFSFSQSIVGTTTLASDGGGFATSCPEDAVLVFDNFTTTVPVGVLPTGQ